MRHIDYNQPAWGQINNEYLLNGKIFLSEMNMTKQIYVYFQRRTIQQLADIIFIQLPFIDIRVITIICFGVFPGGSVVKIRLQCRSCSRHRIDLQVGKIPWRRAWQPNSSILAWRIPWTEKPGGLQSIGSQKAVHD